MRDTQALNPGRKLQQFYGGYGWYDSNNNHRWLYWAVPIIAVGVGVFVFAVVLFLYRRRRAARLSGTPFVQQPQQQPVYGTPVTGWPDYSSQYQHDYANFNSTPAPSASQPPNKQQGVEMGVPPPGYPAHQPSPYGVSGTDQ